MCGTTAELALPCLRGTLWALWALWAQGHVLLLAPTVIILSCLVDGKSMSVAVGSQGWQYDFLLLVFPLCLRGLHGRVDLGAQGQSLEQERRPSG